MTRKLSTVLEKPGAIQVCRHHWLIEPAYGLTSKGVCKYCSAKKEFLNVIQEEVPELKHKNNSSGISIEELINEEEDKKADSDNESEEEI